MLCASSFPQNPLKLKTLRHRVCRMFFLSVNLSWVRNISMSAFSLMDHVLSSFVCYRIQVVYYKSLHVVKNDSVTRIQISQLEKSSITATTTRFCTVKVRHAGFLKRTALLLIMSRCVRQLSGYYNFRYDSYGFECETSHYFYTAQMISTKRYGLTRYLVQSRLRIMSTLFHSL